MQVRQYNAYSPRPVRRRNRSKKVFLILALLVLVGGGFAYYKWLNRPVPIEEAVINQLRYDETVGVEEKKQIATKVKEQSKSISGVITTSVTTKSELNANDQELQVYVPVAYYETAVQNLSTDEIANYSVKIWHDVDEKAKSSIEDIAKLSSGSIQYVQSLDELKKGEIAFIPASELNYSVKLLSLDGNYYLDNFNKGAIFRVVSFSGGSAKDLTSVNFTDKFTKDNIMTVNQTGVTALTRVMMKMLWSNNNPTYFSEKIGSFLANADITHVSNEVSFKPDCGLSNSAFCSDPRFIETLKASGVDLVELTGNHNNDTGTEYNTETINLYHSLGWHTFGGGLNAEEAAKYYVADVKQSKVAFLGYNYADTPHGLAMSTSTTAGSNSFDFDKIKTDIEKAKTEAKFVIVDVQYWECYSYPDGYIEFPECDLPIGEQESVFKQLIDLGADMVIGTQAHHPQTYELYKGKQIFYGLGNLYFDQTQWPGTERGIILTHYFNSGKLLQTKLTPTIFDSNLQTAPMEDADAVKFLDRLLTAK